MRRFLFITCLALIATATSARAQLFPDPFDPDTRTLACDINGDGTVDVADVVALVDEILYPGTDSCDDGRCDVNGDGTVNVQDMQLLNEIVLGLADCPGDLVHDDGDYVSCPGVLELDFALGCDAWGLTPALAIAECEQQMAVKLLMPLWDYQCTPCEEELPCPFWLFDSKPCMRTDTMETPFDRHFDMDGDWDSTRTGTRCTTRGATWT